MEPQHSIRRLNISHSSPINAELAEVYALLQRGTAKGKLLAERVGLRSYRCDISSLNLLMYTIAFIHQSNFRTNLPLHNKARLRQGALIFAKREATSK